MIEKKRGLKYRCNGDPKPVGEALFCFPDPVDRHDAIKLAGGQGAPISTRDEVFEELFRASILRPCVGIAGKKQSVGHCDFNNHLSGVPILLDPQLGDRGGGVAGERAHLFVPGARRYHEARPGEVVSTFS